MAPNGPARLDARAAGRPLQAPDDAGHRLAARGDGHGARPALPRQGRARRGRRQERLPAARARGGRVPRGRRAQPRRLVRADVLHRLDGRAHPRRPPQQPLPPPAAPLARLLRTQPRRRDHQPDHERRRGARPARHGRRHDALPEHAHPRRLGRDPLRARLAARARDAGGDAAHVRARRPRSATTRRERTARSASGSGSSPRRSPRTSPASASSSPSPASGRTRRTSAASTRATAMRTTGLW